MTFQTPPKDFNPRFKIVGCFLESDGKILILKRSLLKKQSNQWGLPAGKADTGESLEQAMAREMQEETGISVKPSELVLLKEMYVRIPANDMLFYLYRLPLSSKHEVVLNPQEHSEFKWATPQEVLKLDFIHDLDECLKIAYGITA